MTSAPTPSRISILAVAISLLATPGLQRMADATSVDGHASSHATRPWLEGETHLRWVANIGYAGTAARTPVTFRNGKYQAVDPTARWNVFGGALTRWADNGFRFAFASLCGRVGALLSIARLRWHTT